MPKDSSKAVIIFCHWNNASEDHNIACRHRSVKEISFQVHSLTEACHRVNHF